MTLHVLAQNYNWLVKEEGDTTALSVHQTQFEAVEAAHRRAKTKKAELVIHGRDGRIVDRKSVQSSYVMGHNH